MGEQGLVQLEISYDSTLNSNQVRVVSSSGYSRLDLAAVQAAQKINPSDISNNSPYLMNVKFELKQNSK
jgi:TonB family protein